jgi:uncharacterized protein (TIGR02391 family)
MLNLEPRLDRRLWAAIDNAYQGSNYTGAILDAIHFLGELMREKTGLDGDGVALVGQAFGGQNPLLKITKLQTESDVSIQKGVEAFLRGLYQGIRNPRSHEKYVDNLEDAEALILFKVLTPEESDEFCGVVSQELETTSNELTIRAVLQIIPDRFWNKYSEVARIRTEGMLIESVRVGRYDSQTDKCMSGGLATWGTSLLSDFILKDKLSYALAAKLDSSDDAGREYVLHFFLSSVLSVFPTPSPILVLRLRARLKAGDARIMDMLSAIRAFDETNPWTMKLKQEMDTFVAAQDFSTPITDDSVPF